MLSVYSYADCMVISFKENYSENFQKNEIFFIKGVALDVFEYGRTIKVIEDLKGNYTGESSIFVWGGGSPSEGSGFVCISNERSDNITQYQENDTLIMIVVKSYSYESCPIEDSNDYATIACAYSVLKLSNGFVTGYIRVGVETMLWEELQELLSNSTTIQSVEIQNNIHQHNGTIFFENSENKIINLLFYDLSGKLIHEATTTSNSYRPVLKGNIFVCKIKINDKLYTIKYIVP